MASHRVISPTKRVAALRKCAGWKMRAFRITCVAKSVAVLPQMAAYAFRWQGAGDRGGLHFGFSRFPAATRSAVWFW